MEPNFIVFYDSFNTRSYLLIKQSYLDNIPDFQCIAHMELLEEELDTNWGYKAETNNVCVEFNKATKERYNLNNYRAQYLYGNNLECLGKLINMLDATRVESKDELRFIEM